MPRELRAFLAVTSGAAAQRRDAYLRRVDFFTEVFTHLFTRRAQVGVRRYRGAAGTAIARDRGISGYDSRNILSVPIYADVAPPPGLARSLAIQWI